MRQRLANAPRWVLGLVMGTFTGVWMIVWSFATQSTFHLVPALITGLLGGAFFGLVMSSWMVKQRQAARQAADVTDDDVYAQAVSASGSGRGAPPADPEVRAAAAQLVRRRMDVLSGQRPWAVPMFTVAAITAVWFALSETPWWWLAVVLFVAVLVLTLVEPTRLRRRLDRLEY